MRLLTRIFYSFLRIAEWLTYRLRWVAASALMATALLLCVNILARIFYEPILGVYEIVGLMTAILVSFSVAYTQVLKGHIAIPIVVSRLPKRVQAAMTNFSYLVSLVVAGLIAWRTVLHANIVLDQSAISGALPIPTFPFVYALAFGFAVLGLVLLTDLFHSLAKTVKK